MDINYIRLIQYLNENQGEKYADPNKPGLSEEERTTYLYIREQGQCAVAETKKIAETCKAAFKLDKYYLDAWLDGSNTKVRQYLWRQMKYADYADSPISISFFVEEGKEETSQFRITLEIKNDGSDKTVMRQYHSHLELKKDEALTYVLGSNELGTPTVLNLPQDIIIAKVNDGEYKFTVTVTVNGN